MNTPYSSLFYIYCWSGKSSAADRCLRHLGSPWRRTTTRRRTSDLTVFSEVDGRWVGAGWAGAKWDDTQPVTWASWDYHPVVSHMAGKSAGKSPRFLGKSSKSMLAFPGHVSLPEGIEASSQRPRDFDGSWQKNMSFSDIFGPYDMWHWQVYRLAMKIAIEHLHV